MQPSSDAGRQLLRHTVATLAYRGGKALRGAPADFGAFFRNEAAKWADVAKRSGTRLD